MQLGLYHSCFMNWDLDKTVAWMNTRGLHFAELHGGPRYGFIDWQDVAKGHTSAILKPAEQYGISIVDIMFGGLNFLHPDAAEREKAVLYGKTLLDAARLLGIDSVSVFTGRDPMLSLTDNFARMKDVFPGLIDYAESKSVRLLLENCPMVHDWPPTYNVAISPSMWKLIFDHFASPYFGLNFDPSHLVWQDIDYLDALCEFKDVIQLVQAKDTLRLPHVIRKTGIVDPRAWEHRIAGHGEVDWNRFLGVLLANNYSGPLLIEHEDAHFSASDESTEIGLNLTIANLSPFLAGVTL